MNNLIAIDARQLTSARLVPRADLEASELAEMYSLLSSYFDGVRQDQFQSDLQQKSHVILIEREQRLVGFTTLLAYETAIDDEAVSVIYSGDTIVAPDAWGSSALPRAWIESVASLRKQFPRGRYLWLLLTSGFRTYRLLPLFWREFYPRFDQPTPPLWQALLDQLAVERFTSQFDRRKGVVRFTCPQRLAVNMAGIPAGRLHDPHVGFFTRQNPGHMAGDELVCLCELAPQNLTSAGRRMASAVPTW